MRILRISTVCTFNLGTILAVETIATIVPSTFLVDPAVSEALYFGDHFPHVSWQKR